MSACNSILLTALSSRGIRRRGRGEYTSASARRFRRAGSGRPVAPPPVALHRYRGVDARHHSWRRRRRHANQLVQELAAAEGGVASRAIPQRGAVHQAAQRQPLYGCGARGRVSSPRRANRCGDGQTDCRLQPADDDLRRRRPRLDDARKPHNRAAPRCVGLELQPVCEDAPEHGRTGRPSDHDGVDHDQEWPRDRERRRPAHRRSHPAQHPIPIRVRKARDRDRHWKHVGQGHRNESAEPGGRPPFRSRVDRRTKSCDTNRWLEPDGFGQLQRGDGPPARRAARCRASFAPRARTLLPSSCDDQSRTSGGCPRQRHARRPEYGRKRAVIRRRCQRPARRAFWKRSQEPPGAVGRARREHGADPQSAGVEDARHRARRFQLGVQPGSDQFQLRGTTRRRIRLSGSGRAGQGRVRASAVAVRRKRCCVRCQCDDAGDVQLRHGRPAACLRAGRHVSKPRHAPASRSAFDAEARDSGGRNISIRSTRAGLDGARAARRLDGRRRAVCGGNSSRHPVAQSRAQLLCERQRLVAQPPPLCGAAQNRVAR